MKFMGVLFILKDAVGASMSFAGSALSGNVNSLAVGIYEELDR
jgi:hypothetical protein